MTDAGEPVELKAPSWTTEHEWFDADGDFIVPPVYVCQNIWQQFGMGKDRGLVAGLIGGEVRHKWIDMDLELLGMLKDAATSFWEDYVIPKEPPPLDGSDAAEEFAKRRWPKDDGSFMDCESMSERELAEIAADVVAARHLRDAEKEAKAAYSQAKNRIRQFLGDATGIHIPEVGKVTWKNNKDTEKTEWKPLAEHLLNTLEPETAATMIREFTTTKRGPRVLLLGKAK